MTSKVETIERIFNFNGVKLPDPGASLTLDQVKNHYATIYPEITNSAFKPGEIKSVDGKSVQSFEVKTVTGTKG